MVIDGVQPAIPENPAPAKKAPEELILKKTPEDFKDEKHKDKFNKAKVFEFWAYFHRYYLSCTTVSRS